ncbi:MAG: VCBS repeat-containing protein [Pirellulaceae bacterium]|nr:VCBS repeat-containing protein [Pirellulaceae bacterium]
MVRLTILLLAMSCCCSAMCDTPNTLRFTKRNFAYSTDGTKPLDHAHYRDGKLQTDKYSGINLTGHHVQLVDMDGDGDLDILALDHKAMPRIRWYESLRNANKVPPLHTIDKPIVVNKVTAIRLLLPVDLDGDKRMDLVALGTNLTVFHNHGKTKPWTVTKIAELRRNRHAALADVDRDGDQDVVLAGNVLASGSKEGVIWFANTGKGKTWERARPIFLGGGVPLLQLADLDGDKDMDVVLFEVELNRLLFLANDDKGTSWQEHVVVDWLGTTQASYSYPSRFAIGDIDKDGRTNLVTTHNDGKVYSWSHEGGKTGLQRTELFTLPGSRSAPKVEQLLVVDLDQDRQLDVVVRLRVLTKGVDIWWYQRKRDTWQRKDIPTNRDYNNTQLAIGDWDGDHDLDIVTSTSIRVPQPMIWAEN